MDNVGDLRKIFQLAGVHFIVCRKNNLPQAFKAADHRVRVLVVASLLSGGELHRDVDHCFESCFHLNVF